MCVGSGCPGLTTLIAWWFGQNGIVPFLRAKIDVRQEKLTYNLTLLCWIEWPPGVARKSPMVWSLPLRWKLLGWFSISLMRWA